jgi:hypothetical protein
VGELEPTFLLLREDMRANDILLGRCLDRGQLLITEARLRQSCKVVISDEEAIRQFATS